MFDKPQLTDVRRIFILLFFLSFFVVSLANKGDELQTENKINWITVWLSFFFGLIFTVLFRFLNKISKKVDQRRDAGQPFGGWIIFLGINLIVRIIAQAYFFWKSDYFLKETWIHLEQSGGIKFQSLFIFEFFLSMFALSATGVLLYWYFGKRDIFPAMFVYYVAIYLVVSFTRIIIYPNIGLPSDIIEIYHNIYFQLLRILYAAAWLIYVLKSQRIKQTFIYPPN